MEALTDLLPGFITGGALVAIGGLILKFWQEKRAGNATAVAEWREMNKERKEEARELKKEIEALRALVFSLVMEVQRLDPESPILEASRAFLQPKVGTNDEP